MIEFRLGPFFTIMTRIGSVADYVKGAGKDRSSEPPRFGEVVFLDETWRTFIRAKFQDLPEQLELLDARVTIIAVQEALDCIDKPYTTWGDAVQALDEIRNSLRRELHSVMVFIVEGDRHKYFAPDFPLCGSEVSAKFPSISYEVQEAGKCLAFERSTASAFHSIRCLEAAIRAMSRCLDIPDPTKASDRSWFKTLEAIKKELQHRWPTTGSKMSGDGRFFEEAYAALAAMQNPWRNATMHLDQIYTEEAARDLFNVVGGFMRRIAARIDENGAPKA
jgi:hypothetical protein